jgi:hypothetical protein
MVGSMNDPRMFEADAPVADHKRKPLPKRDYTNCDDRDRLHAKTVDLEAAVSLCVWSDNYIPVIHNTEDYDIAYEAMSGLSHRNYKAMIFMEAPRYYENGRLDPNWLRKFHPILENCDVAVYARRIGTQPNPATRTELEILAANSKPVIIYEVS